MQYVDIKEKNNNHSYFYYMPNFITHNEIEKYTNWLDNMDDFNPNYNYNENSIIRYQKWYQKNMLYFCPTWKEKYKRWESFMYDDTITSLQNKIDSTLREDHFSDLGISIPNLNSILIQKYMNGEQYISAHRDTDKSFGYTPTIINISFGSPRTIIFKRVIYNGSNKKMSKLDKQNKHVNMQFTLAPGSLFIMAGDSQKHWTHQIDKEPDKGVRYSLTFREYET
tara:strand:- start:155 stop:826 length:672 start_codon:yes stop_codon:yes gene_type:complete